MADPHLDDERLYAWVRVFGSILFMVTVAVIALALIVLPLVSPGYAVSEPTIIFVVGSLSASALAMAGLRVVRRNGNGQ